MVQSSVVALLSNLEPFSSTTAQLSNRHVTCNQCKLLKIAKRLQKKWRGFHRVFDWNSREQCKTVHICCEMWEFRNTQVLCWSRYSLYLIRNKKCMRSSITRPQWHHICRLLLQLLCKSIGGKGQLGLPRHEYALCIHINRLYLKLIFHVSLKRIEDT